MPSPLVAAAPSRAHATRLPALLLALLLVPTALAPSARADDGPETSQSSQTSQAEVTTAAERVAQAQRQVEAMQQQVEQTAAVLAEGTARLEQGQARLVETQAASAAADAAAVQADERAAAAKAKVAVVVSASYRSPVPQALQLALTAGPDDIVDAIVARHDLDRVSGDSQDLLALSTAARLEAEQARRHAGALAREAAEQERALASEVARLTEVAQRSEQTLTAAAAALSAAQTDQQSVLAAAEAAVRAREAERGAQAAAGSYVVATCAGMPTGPQANGMLDPSTLCPLDDAPGHALRPDAATAFNALNAFYKQQQGRPLCVGDSYRSYAGQVAVYAAKPQLAAVPGRSNHGWGLAIDLGCGVERFGSPEHEWLRANAARFGWFHPVWAQAGGSRPEAWHWEFAGAR
jgi:LAS superfamily LD-carboxypeptidase LdcB